MHGEVFREKCTKVYNLLWNTSKNMIYWWMDTGIEGCVIKPSTLKH